jgi:hypothetical protein
MARMLACALLLAFPASAAAHDPAAEVPDVSRSATQRASAGPALSVAARSAAPDLWATVNLCDTAAAPDSMGVRAGMPADGPRTRIHVRFRAEYWSRSRQSWTPVAGAGVSPWVRVGAGDRERRQAGWTFAFAAPPAGVTFTMRGIVEFVWRTKGGSVLRSVARATATGLPGVQGGDPAGTSKAMCLIH